MFRLLSIGIILAVLFSAGACQDQGGGSSVDLNPVETFAPEDAPDSYTVDSLSVTGPWGYKKPDNAARRYPIMVIGYWGEGAGTYAAVEQRYPADCDAWRAISQRVAGYIVIHSTNIRLDAANR